MSYPRDCWPSPAHYGVIRPEPQLAAAHVAMGALVAALWTFSGYSWAGLVALVCVVPWVKQTWQRLHSPPIRVLQWLGEYTWHAQTCEGWQTLIFLPTQSHCTVNALLLVFTSQQQPKKLYYLPLTRAHQHPPLFRFLAQYVRWF